MPFRLYFLLTFCALLISPISGEDNREGFLRLLRAQDFDRLAMHLQTWEKTSPRDPELFVAWYNYFLARNAKKVMVSEATPEGPAAGRLYEKVVYDKEDVITAVAYLDSGLKLHPYRLDMHIGKINILGEIEDYRRQTDHILGLVAALKANSGKWKWGLYNQPREDLDMVCQRDIQNRLYKFMMLGTPELQEYVQQISSRMVALFPRNIWYHNDLAWAYFMQKDYPKALRSFHAAEAIDPNDELVQRNIAQCYLFAGDKPNALRYARKLTNAKNPEIRKWAATQVAELEAAK